MLDPPEAPLSRKLSRAAVKPGFIGLLSAGMALTDELMMELIDTKLREIDLELTQMKLCETQALALRGEKR